MVQKYRFYPGFFLYTDNTAQLCQGCIFNLIQIYNKPHQGQVKMKNVRMSNAPHYDVMWLKHFMLFLYFSMYPRNPSGLLPPMTTSPHRVNGLLRRMNTFPQHHRFRIQNPKPPWITFWRWGSPTESTTSSFWISTITTWIESFRS